MFRCWSSNPGPTGRRHRVGDGQACSTLGGRGREREREGKGRGGGEKREWGGEGKRNERGVRQSSGDEKKKGWQGF